MSVLQTSKLHIYSSQSELDFLSLALKRVLNHPFSWPRGVEEVPSIRGETRTVVRLGLALEGRWRGDGCTDSAQKAVKDPGAQRLRLLCFSL